MAGALDGIQILELASYVTGPFAAMLLADLGADVIKVETPGHGDPFRGWGGNLYAGGFCGLNRNKKSITLDIRQDEGRDIFLKLAGSSDVLIENLRPGVMDRNGLGYDAVQALNPSIIYCSISGFGQSGPYRELPGYDTIGQALSGLLSLLTDPETPQGMGVSLSDHLTGVYASYAVLGALMHRQKTGEGQRVETSLLRATLSFLAEGSAHYFDSGQAPSRAKRTHRAGVYAFLDKDAKPFVIHLSSPEKFWRGLLDTVGKPEWAEDERFRDRKARTDNYTQLAAELQAIFRTAARDEWLQRLQHNDVPAAPLQTLAEAYQDPQVQTYGFPVEVEHPKLGKVRMAGSGIELSRTPPQADRLPPPALGEHTREILDSLGYDGESLAQLLEKKVIS